MGPKGVALANRSTTRGCIVLWLHHQEGIQKRPKIGVRTQHARLHPRPQPSEFHNPSGDCQNLAQRAPKKGGRAHLADPQPGPPGGHLALAHGYPTSLQSL